MTSATPIVGCDDWKVWKQREEGIVPKTSDPPRLERQQCQHPGCDYEPEDVVDGRELCASHASQALQKKDRC